jgi:hypothetical protein
LALPPEKLLFQSRFDSHPTDLLQHRSTGDLRDDTTTNGISSARDQ